jgi:cell division protein FtsB
MRHARTALPLGLLLVAVISVPIRVFSAEGLPRMRGLEREVVTVEADNAQARREIAQLRAQVAGLKDDPAAVERIARDQLGMVRASEVVFQFAHPKSPESARP